jgi:hypothetical protein
MPLSHVEQDVENDIGGMDAVSDRLGAGRLDSREPVGQNGVEDVDHLPIAVVGAGELAPDPLDRGRKHPVLEGITVTHRLRRSKCRVSVTWRAPCLRCPCQLALLAGREHGRTIPLADGH